jgi:hypothetical protein
MNYIHKYKKYLIKNKKCYGLMFGGSSLNSNDINFIRNLRLYHLDSYAEIIKLDNLEYKNHIYT